MEASVSTSRFKSTFTSMLTKGTTTSFWMSSNRDEFGSCLSIHIQ